MSTQTVSLSTDEIGQVKLGDRILPGVYQRMEIRGRLRMDKSRVKGRSGTTRLPEGWEDAQVSLELVLCDGEEGTVADQVRQLVKMFQATDTKTARPFVYTIANWQLAAWGIRQVIFSELRSGDDDQTDLVPVTLTFEEWKPPPRKVESRRQVVQQPPDVASGQDSVGQSGTDILGQGVTLSPQLDQDLGFFAGGVGGIDLADPLVQERMYITPLDQATYDKKYRENRPDIDEDQPS